MRRVRHSGPCNMPEAHKHFCIDRYEWPNKEGALPRLHGELGRGQGHLREHRQAPLRRHRVDARLRRAAAPARTPTATATRATRPPATSTSRTSGRTPRRSTDRRRSAEELARLDQREPSGARDGVREPLRRPRHGRQRRRVGRQRVAVRQALQERPQGRLLGPRAHALPPDDHRRTTRRSATTRLGFAAAANAVRRERGGSSCALGRRRRRARDAARVGRGATGAAFRRCGGSPYSWRILEASASSEHLLVVLRHLHELDDHASRGRRLLVREPARWIPDDGRLPASAERYSKST